MSRESSSTRTGAGVQPVPGPTLFECSTASRKAWLTKGCGPATASHEAASIALTPGAIRARTSDSRSAIPLYGQASAWKLGLHGHDCVDFDRDSKRKDRDS